MTNLDLQYHKKQWLKEVGLYLVLFGAVLGSIVTSLFSVLYLANAQEVKSILENQLEQLQKPIDIESDYFLIQRAQRDRNIKYLQELSKKDV